MLASTLSLYRRPLHSLLLARRSRHASVSFAHRALSVSLVNRGVRSGDNDVNETQGGGHGDEEDDDNENEDDNDDDEEDDGRKEPWKALLTTSGRCAWRMSPLPEALNDMLVDITTQSQRTRKVLRRVHESVMEHHLTLARVREGERNRLKSKASSSTTTTDAATKKASTSSSPPRTSMEQAIPYGPNETLADLYFRFVPHFLIVRRVLEETVSLIGRDRLQPKRIIDLGIGCAGASMAALEVFQNTIEWIHGIDPSKPMKQAAERVLAEQSQRLSTSLSSSIPRVTVSSHLSVTSETSAFDMALFCYTAMEFPHNAATIAAAAALWQKLAPGGIFVMVEPGTPDGFKSIRTVRSMLLDCANDTETTFDIIAPCTHNGTCPMDKFHLNNKVFKQTKKKKKVKNHEQKKDVRQSTKKENEEEDDDSITSNNNAAAANAEDNITGDRSGFCSFVQTMPHGDKKEKFSYLVARKKPRGEIDDQHQFHGDRLAELLQTSLQSSKEPQEPSMTLSQQQVLDLREKYVNSEADEEIGLELIRSDRQGFGRIIHAPIKKKGHVMIDACVAPGEMVRFKIRKRFEPTVPGVYAAAKKSRWGGFWPNVPKMVE